MHARHRIPSLGLIFLVLGTIFMGLATPTEAGAMGVVGAIALAAFYGTLELAAALSQGMATTMRITAMVVFILIGARVFSLVFQGVGGKEWIEHLLTALPGGQIGFLIFVNIFIFVIAFFLDFFEIAFIIIPLLAPVADKLGIDLIWFGVLICANIQTSFMHPPFGFALFYLRGIAPQKHQDNRHLSRRNSLAVPAGPAGHHPDRLAGLGHLLARQGTDGRPKYDQDRHSAARPAAARFEHKVARAIKNPGAAAPGFSLCRLSISRASRASCTGRRCSPPPGPLIGALGEGHHRIVDLLEVGVALCHLGVQLHALPCSAAP